MNVQPIQTRVFRAGEDLTRFVLDEVPKPLIREGMVLAVTSKIMSLAENRLVAKASIDKADLVDQEADHNFGEVGYGCYLTIKHGLFIPTAGIDESNSEHGHYILYPRDPFRSAERLGKGLRRAWGLEKLGILVTDSHTTPLRRGVTGVSLAHWGFRGLRDFIGQPDLFGRKMEMTTVNVADALAAAATLRMGESNESRPLACIEMEDLVFLREDDPLFRTELTIPLESDLYYPFFRAARKPRVAQGKATRRF
ncbi:MAG: coenzyme F420-0:L-glutamate ligase [Bacteriovoracia bacterium]